MVRVILFLGIAIVLFLLIRWLFRQPPRVYWQWLVILLALGLILMVATGRAHWLAAVFAAILPFMRTMLGLLGSFPLLKRVFSGMGAAKSNTQSSDEQSSSSTVQSSYIRMTLAHDSGDINGEVLRGQFEGRSLRQMSLDELLQLLAECQHDEESLALLQAYLDRVYADQWRQQADAEGQRQTANGADEISRDEALQILGLLSDASDEEIVEAHRRLMQKLHPDRGGSSYLAAKINLAKDTLLAS